MIAPLVEDTRRYEDRHYSQCPLCQITRSQWPGQYCYHHHDSKSAKQAYGLMKAPNLEACRQAAGLFVEELADEAFLMPRTIYQIEDGGYAKKSTVFKLARALGVGISELTGEE